jgi:hypothetical protein
MQYTDSLSIDICQTIQLLWYTVHSIQTGHIGMPDKTANIFFKDFTLYGNLASVGDLGSDICVGLLQTVTFLPSKMDSQRATNSEL